MFESIFDIPLVIAGLAIVGLLCLFAIGGLLLVRRFVCRVCDQPRGRPL